MPIYVHHHVVSVPTLQDDLQEFAEPSVCVQDFRTPLMEAIIHDNDKLVELLINAGADVNAVDLVSKRCAGVPVRRVSRFIK